MIGSSDEITARILDAHDNLGGIDGLYGRVHWGGLPRGLLEASINLLATEIAPPSARRSIPKPRALQLTSTGKDTTR